MEIKTNFCHYEHLVSGYLRDQPLITAGSPGWIWRSGDLEVFSLLASVLPSRALPGPPSAVRSYLGKSLFISCCVFL